MKRISLLAFATCVLMGAALAQSAANSGAIIGQVLDPSSAAVQGARVTVRNQGTNLTRRTTTDGSGRYAIADVPLDLMKCKPKLLGLRRRNSRL